MTDNFGGQSFTFLSTSLDQIDCERPSKKIKTDDNDDEIVQVEFDESTQQDMLKVAEWINCSRFRKRRNAISEDVSIYESDDGTSAA